MNPQHYEHLFERGLNRDKMLEKCLTPYITPIHKRLKNIPKN